MATPSRDEARFEAARDPEMKVAPPTHGYKAQSEEYAESVPTLMYNFAKRLRWRAPDSQVKVCVFVGSCVLVSLR